MKKILLIASLVILCLIIIVQIDANYRNENVTKIETVLIDKSQIDSTVNLSFLDFSLGDSYKKCLSLSQKNHRIDLVSQYEWKNEHRNEFKTIFENDNLTFRVMTHKDTIRQIVLFFGKNIGGVNVDSIFIGKYGLPKKDGIWNYKNAIIELDNVYESSSEYVRKSGTENLKLRNFNNAYEKKTTSRLTGVTVIYTDKNITRKMELADSIAKINKLRADSLHKIQLQKRQDSIEIAKRLERQTTKERIIDNL